MVLYSNLWIPWIRHPRLHLRISVGRVRLFIARTRLARIRASPSHTHPTIHVANIYHNAFFTLAHARLHVYTSPNGANATAVDALYFSMVTLTTVGYVTT